MSFSKSEEKALSCKRYYAGTYLSDEPAVKLLESSPLADTGTDFHSYRSTYVNHLVRNGLRRDEDWARRWLDNAMITDDARGMISADIPRYEIDPDEVLATELFLSADSDFRPLRRIPNSGPGRIQKLDEEYIDGTLDIACARDSQALIDDYKTGWSNSAVTEYEAAHYSVLVFSHFSYIESVRFAWEFTRARARDPLTYTRADLEWMLPMVRSAVQQKSAIREAFERGDELPVNPTSGMCAYCQLTCPVRQAVTRNVLEIPPLQTKDDAITVAQRLVVAELYAQTARERLRSYLNETGTLDIGSGWIAEMRAGATQEFRLDKVLDLFGIPAGETSKIWDVPLSSVKVSGTSLKSFAKAEKRRGMQEALDKISRDKPRFELRIGKREAMLPETTMHWKKLSGTMANGYCSRQRSFAP